MSDPVLVASSVTAGYRPDMPILNGVSITVGRAELVTIIGPNGAGKSTLIKAIAGLVTVTDGQICFRNLNLIGQTPQARVTAGIAYVPQTQNIFTTLSIHHNLCLAGHTLDARARRQRVAEIYTLYPLLAEKRSAKGRVLSGGQRQILAIAMALVCSPALIMLDEPSAGLAPKAVGDVFSRLRLLVGQGVSVLLVEQNAKAALAISDRAYVLAEGRNQLDGPATALLNDNAVADVYLGARRAAQSSQCSR